MGELFYNFKLGKIFLILILNLESFFLFFYRILSELFNFGEYFVELD